MTKTQSSRKILFVLPALSTGGAERVLITLMNTLDRSAYKPELLTITDRGGLEHLIAPDIVHHRLSAPGVLRGLPRLYKVLRATKPDITISTMAHVNFAVLSLRRFFPHTRFIVREAITPSFLLNKYPKSARLIRGLYKRLYPRASCIISPAGIINDELAAITGMGYDRFSTLPNPVNTDQLRAYAHSPVETIQNQSQAHLTFVAAGRLGYQKGFDRLIAALAEAEFDYDWHLTILGEGHERDTLQAQIERLGLGDHVAMPGLYSNPWPAYGQADVFVLPSRYEGLPNVVLEALACGTPVIAMAEAGGVHEIARVCAPGAVTICADMDAFVRAMTEATPRCGNAAGDKPSLLPEQYEIQEVAKSFNAMLDRVAAERFER